MSGKRPAEERNNPRRKKGAGPAPPLKEPQIFEGSRVVFWASKMVQIMKQRVQQLGGILQPVLAADTTHVVCPPDLTAEKAISQLSGWLGPTEELLVGKGAAVHLPQGVAFVTPDWVSRSIARKQLQPLDQFVPAGLAPAPSAAVPRDEESADADQGRQQQPPQEQQQEQETATDAVRDHEAAAVPERQPTSSVTTVSFTAQELAAVEEVQQQTQICRVERRGSEFVAVEGCKPQYTGGDTGIGWGSFGVWDEPYDPAAARETVETLRGYWYQMRKQAQQAAQPPPPGTQLNGVCSHVCCAKRPFCVIEKLETFKKTVYVEGRGTDIFKRKALDKAVQALITWPEPLDTAEDVSRVPGVGAKTVDKVKEILQTGASSRVAAVAADQQTQVLNRFMEVWGAGPATASHWWDLGARTLEDLLTMQDIHLTEQQRVGVRYFDDLAQKIPRDEVARAEGIVREACFELIERKGGAADVERTYCFATGSYRRGKPQSSDIDILICLPPSLRHADVHAFLAELLTALLDKQLLLDELSPRQGPHASGMHASWMGLARPPGAPCVRRIDVKVYANAATPFAVNYFANSQAFCRATRYWANNAVPEVARRHNPAANGFKISDTAMVPIFRKKGGHSRRRSMDSEHAGGSGSDSEGKSCTTGDGTAVLEPAVHCPDETAIFRELGLAYVPTHMRFFHEFF